MTRPEAPANLGQLLSRYYPLEAIVKQQEGQVLAMLEVAASGKVEVAEVKKATSESFESACRRVLQNSRWEPARDVEGRPARYKVWFTCLFERASITPPRTATRLGGSRPEGADRVRTRGLATLGPLTPEAIGDLLARHYPAVVSCFEGQFAPPGDYRLAFRSLPGGTLERLAWIDKPDVKAGLGHCLLQEISRWRFPTASSATVTDLRLQVPEK